MRLFDPPEEADFYNSPDYFFIQYIDHVIGKKVNIRLSNGFISEDITIEEIDPTRTWLLFSHVHNEEKKYGLHRLKEVRSIIEK